MRDCSGYQTDQRRKIGQVHLMDILLLLWKFCDMGHCDLYGCLIEIHYEYFGYS